jgi:hypothetical protein
MGMPTAPAYSALDAFPPNARRGPMHDPDATQKLPIEQRRQERYDLLHQPSAPVYVLMGWARFAAMAVKDVSSGGVSLYLERELPVGSRVSIEYATRSMKLDVQGVVAWCHRRQAQDPELAGALHTWVLGVELFSPVLLLSAFRDALPVQALTMAGI